MYVTYHTPVYTIFVVYPEYNKSIGSYVLLIKDSCKLGIRAELIRWTRKFQFFKCCIIELFYLCPMLTTC